jgi:hypothetical protein
MPRTLAELPKGARLTDFISLGVIARKYPRRKIDEVLQKTGRASIRERQLPAHVVVYYVIALGLYLGVSYGEVLRCLLEGLGWIGWPIGPLRRTAKSAISQARSRLGWEPLKQLYEEVVTPIAERATAGAWYRDWRLVALDGTTLEMGDTAENEREFGRPGASRGKSGYPQLRLVFLSETGTHVLFGAALGGYPRSETELARQVLPQLRSDMLCLADRNYFGYGLWRAAEESGAALLWRIKKNLNLPCLERLPDGSYLSRIYPSDKARRHDRQGITVRVIEYRLEGVEDAEPIYRLVTNVLEVERAPAEELVRLYPERWEIEGAFDELKTHLRGHVVLRSKKPALVRQEVYGLLLAHFAVRGLMHEAALQGRVDPDKLSFVHAVRVVRRKLPQIVAFPPSGKNEPA